ncbi:hypothetical protein [Nocardia sp. NPDC047038]|uniref:hypothetical protein n=1 Tax=Nocardia sp. NPDC047038 TaxID=3154338 RepID=UPI0033F6DD00
MDQEALVDQLLDGAGAIIPALAMTKTPVTTAFAAFDLNSDRWMLILGVRNLKSKLAAYENISKAMRSTQVELPLDSIVAIDSGGDLLRFFSQLALHHRRASRPHHSSTGVEFGEWHFVDVRGLPAGVVSHTFEKIVYETIQAFSDPMWSVTYRERLPGDIVIIPDMTITEMASPVYVEVKARNEPISVSDFLHALGMLWLAQKDDPSAKLIIVSRGGFPSSTKRRARTLEDLALVEWDGFDPGGRRALKKSILSLLRTD